MKVYLAGPMSGYPAFNIPAFDAAAETLRMRGHVVVSPAEVDGPVDREVLLRSERGSHDDLPADADYDGYLDRDLFIIATGSFDAIVTLPGWSESKGANREVDFAARLGVPRWDFDPASPVGFGDSWPDHADLSVDERYEDDGTFINAERQRAITGAVKDNRSKSRVDLIPSKPLFGVGRVMAFGAAKYKPHNWRLGLGWSDTIASALRHILAFADGEDIDPESGECHVDNALCQLFFLSEYYHTRTGQDDRWSSQPEATRDEAAL